MRFTKTTRKVKCKKCGNTEICYKDTLKKVNICPNCIESYKETRINCVVCKKSFKRGNEYFIEESKWKNKNFCCEKCYKDYELEELEKEKMIEWLKQYFKVETLPTRIYMQIDDFKNKKKIPYKWIFATLRYQTKIKCQELQEGTIGIVPYMVDECKEHVSKIKDVKRRAKESEINKATFTDNVVIIKRVNVNAEREKFMRRKMITEKDLEGIVEW